MSCVPIVGSLALPAFWNDPDTGGRFSRTWLPAPDDRDLQDCTCERIRGASRRHPRHPAMGAQRRV